MKQRSGQVRKRIDHLLDESGGTRRQRRVWALAGGGIGLDGYDLFIMSAALPLLRDQFGLGSAAALAWLGAAAVVGAIPGALVSGILADRFGRRVVLRVDVLVFAATAVACALAWNPASLIVFRLIQGFAIGAEYPISAALVAEVMPQRNRGRWMTGAFAFQALGMVLAAAASTIILLIVDADSAWRWMLLSGVVPAIAVGVLRQRLPESPRWLARHGRTVAALASLEWLLGPEAARQAAGVSHPNGPRREEEPRRRGELRELFSRSLRARTTLVTIPWFVMDIALYGLGMFTPMIVLAALSSSGPLTGDMFLVTDVEATAAATLADTLLLVGFLANILLVERVGRMRLQFGGFIGMAVGTFIVALAARSDTGTAAVIVGFMVFNLAVNLGPNATTYLVPAEVYPTRLRTTGHGFAAACGKVGATVGVLLLPVMLASYGRTSVMICLGVLCALGAGVTLLLRIETRGALPG